MKVAITQPNFIPWLGYFDLLDTVDLWVSYDNVGLSKGSFVYRNRIKLKNGKKKWITVHLKRYAMNTPLNRVVLAHDGWWDAALRSLEDNYRDAPYYEDVMRRLGLLLPPRPGENVLSLYNHRLVLELRKTMGIRCESMFSSDLSNDLQGSAHEKVMTILKEVGATEFYNFANGIEAGLYDLNEFRENGVKVFKQDYAHPEYPQSSGNFVPYLSAVDLLFNVASPLSVIRHGRNWTRVA